MSNRIKKLKRKRVVTTQSDKSLTGGVHFCCEHQGKMTGIHSVSTSCLVNKLCQERRLNSHNICHSCFSASMMEGVYKHSMPEILKQNTDILTSGILSDDVLPYWVSRDGRIESFGDLNNWIQAANYINIIRKNPSTHFAWWTKNPWFIQEAIDRGYKLPTNVQIILSSIKVNVQETPVHDFVSKVFTVYSEDYLEQHPEVVINCGSKCCIACEACYKKNPRGIKVQFINELLK